MIRPVGRLCLALSLAALLAGGVLPVAAAAPAPEPASRERVDYLELRQDDLKSDLNSKLDALEKRIAEKLKQTEGSVKDDIEKQDKRVADLQVILGQQANFGQWLSIGVGLLEIILLFLGALVGYLGYKRLSDEGKKRLKKMEKLLSEMEEKAKDASTHHEGIKNDHEDIKQTKAKTVSILNELQELKERKGETSQEASPELTERVKEAERHLEEKPSSGLTAEEWFFRALSADMQKKPYAEIAAYDELIERFAASAALEDLTYVAKALVNKGITLGQLDKSEEAIACYDDVAERFGKRTESSFLEPVASALLSKGVTLGQSGKSEEEIACYDDVVKRFGERPEPTLQEQVAKALFNKGVTLGQLGKSEEEIASLEEVVKRFGKTDNPELKELVETAQEGIDLAKGATKENPDA